MLLSALLLPGLAFAADPTSHTFPDAHRLWIQSIVGDVSVQGGGQTMEVTATPGRWDEGCGLVFSPDVQPARVEVTRSRRSLQCEVALHVVLPADTRLRVEVETGDVALAELAGPVDLEVGQGDVALTDQGGSLFARIEEGGLSGSLTGSVTAEIEEGSADLRWATAPQGPVIVQTKRGDITLTLPAGTAIDPEVRARKGEERVELPSQEGGVVIEASTSNGDVTVHPG